MIATSPMLPFVIALLAAPVVIALLWCAFRLARNSHQRLMNLIAGGIGAVVAPIVMILSFTPAPNSWSEDWFALLVVAAMTTGAIVGELACFGLQRLRLGLRRPGT